MRVGHWLLGIAGALALGLAAASAEAAPAGNSAIGLKDAAGDAAASAVEQVRRRCWRHHGHLHCRHVGRYYHPRYYYGYNDWGRRHGHRRHFGIQGPGFGLYVGPRYNRYYW